jgi:hypothetical protein
MVAAMVRTYCNYFKKNILFACRRRKNFEVLIMAVLLSETSLKLSFESTFFQLAACRYFETLVTAQYPESVLNYCFTKEN